MNVKIRNGIQNEYLAEVDRAVALIREAERNRFKIVEKAQRVRDNKLRAAYPGLSIVEVFALEPKRVHKFAEQTKKEKRKARAAIAASATEF